jgi:hypothetical protein
MRWEEHVARKGAQRHAYRVLVGKPEGKRPLGSLRRRWNDTIKMKLKVKGWCSMDYINLAQDRAMNLRVSYNVWKFLSSWAAGDFSIRYQLHGVRIWGSHNGGYEEFCMAYHFSPKDGDIFLRNFGWLPTDYDSLICISQEIELLEY